MQTMPTDRRQILEHERIETRTLPFARLSINQLTLVRDFFNSFQIVSIWREDFEFMSFKPLGRFSPDAEICPRFHAD